MKLKVSFLDVFQGDCAVITFDEGGRKVCIVVDGGETKKAAQRLAAYQALEARLVGETASRHVTPVAGGISQARKDTVEEDDDRVAPAFARGQFDHPETESDDNELLL